MLQHYGFEPKVASWKPSEGKGIDDVCVAQGPDFVHRVIAEAKPFSEWESSLPKSWLRTKAKRPPGYAAELKRIEVLHAQLNAKPVADIVLNQRYLDPGELPDAGSALLVDSPMSTGKTSTLLMGIVVQQRDRHPDAIGISSAYRNILLRQSGAALGFTHWLDTDGDPSLAKFSNLAACPRACQSWLIKKSLLARYC